MAQSPTIRAGACRGAVSRRAIKEARDFFAAHPVEIVRDLEHSFEKAEPFGLGRLGQSNWNKLDHWTPRLRDHESFASRGPLYQARQMGFRLMNVDRRHGWLSRLSPLDLVYNAHAFKQVFEIALYSALLSAGLVSGRFIGAQDLFVPSRKVRMNAPRILAGRAGGGFPFLAGAARDILKITKQWICPPKLAR